jgi:hypothetical protein
MIIIGFMIVAVLLVTLAIWRKPWAMPEKIGATVVGLFFIPMLISAFWNEALYEWIALAALAAGTIFVAVDELGRVLIKLARLSQLSECLLFAQKRTLPDTRMMSA